MFGLNDKFISHIKFLLKSKSLIDWHDQILTKQILVFFFLK